MTKRNLFAWLLAFGLVVGVFQMIPASVHARTGPAITQPSAAKDEDAKGAKTYVGRIAQTDDGKYVLVEDGTKIRYLLDDQVKAKQFDGQNVKVTGTYDVASETIRVQDIQGA